MEPEQVRILPPDTTFRNEMDKSRVTNEHCLHTEYNPSLCKRGIEPCGIARCIDRHGTLKDYITVECSKCGEQKDVPDFFDEEYS